MRTIRVDEHIEDADWIKARRWDLPTTLEGLLEFHTPERLRHLLELPAAAPMPEALRAEVVAYLAKQDTPDAKTLMDAADEIVAELRRRH